jgi:hypothetical protein
MPTAQDSRSPEKKAVLRDASAGQPLADCRNEISARWDLEKDSRMKILTFGFLVMSAGAAASAVAACSSSSDAGAGVDSGADCAIPSSVVYACDPISESEIVGDAALADGAALCPPLPSHFPGQVDGDAAVGDPAARYPLGCNATIPEYSAFTNNQTGCNPPVSCTCQISGTAPSFICAQ